MVFDIRSICPALEFYSPRNRKLFQGALEDSDGRSIGVIHPTFLREYIDEFYERTISHEVKQAMSQDNYESFLAGLGAYLERSELPGFVFAPDRTREDVEAWLGGLNLAYPMALVSTEFNGPAPMIKTGGLRPQGWGWFKNHANWVGTREISLIGEAAYVELGKKFGCVYIAEVALASTFKVEIIHEQTFPNLETMSAELSYVFGHEPMFKG
jgi:hypothetical protein